MFFLTVYVFGSWSHQFHPSLLSQKLLSLPFFIFLFLFFLPLSRLDYCKSPLSGSPQYLLNKLQKVQNNTACFVLRVPQTDHISSYILLRIDQWIQYKLASQCLNSTDPGYLPELKIYKPTRQLCSSKIPPFFVFPLCIGTRLVTGLFTYLLTYRLGLFLIPHRVWNLTISLVKLGH